MQKLFVVVSGLPASGKTSLARRLAPALDLPPFDKDDILDRLFELKGIGDAAWRRKLSRESDAILQQEAASSSGAVLVSFWHVPGMPSDSGTPTDWLHAPSHRLVNVHCVCELEVAARRYVDRERHPGHLDRDCSYADILDSFRALARLAPLDVRPRIEIETSQEPRIKDVILAIHGSG